jgi:hypothetical protein
MSKSLIRKNQLSADISDLVGEYGSGFFIGINSSGHLINSLAEVVSGDFRNIVRTTGEQNISGVKTFASRPTVNGTGFFLSGDSFVAPNFNSAPINPVMGQIYFDTNSNNFSGYNGTAWTRLNN